MKMIDQNGRLFGKISIVDVIVILVVAVMAAALYVKTNTLTHTSTSIENETITYQVYCRGVPDYVADSIWVEDLIYDEDRPSSGCLGEITMVEVLPGTEQVTFDDGTVEVVSAEETVDLCLTIEGEGLVDGKRYALNRIYDLGVNSARNFITAYARFTGTVISIG